MQTVWKHHRRLAGDGTWDKVVAPLLAEADHKGLVDCDVAVDSTINRAHQRGTNIHRPAPATRGTVELQECARVEPECHALGSSRAVLCTKVHTLTDGCGRPLVILFGPCQGGDSPMLPVLLDQLRIARVGPGRPRTTPHALLGDKAYAARAHRAMLSRRGIRS